MQHLPPVKRLEIQSYILPPSPNGSNISICDMNPKDLFLELYQAPTELEVDDFIERNPDIFAQSNWYPYGQSESYFAVVENQQASPIAALVEKVINSIDAILMRGCHEAGIDPKSQDAPRSIEDAINAFFPDAKNWDLPGVRRKQAESIQILADGPRRNTSLIVYDDGEGQHPEQFEKTFLSLLRGNKNEIHFVQGKYNMGGSGAIVFCGKRRYQLIGSKRHDGAGEFGFTLMRKHPLSEDERKTKKNTWYEYLKIDGRIPAFTIDTLDLNLHKRPFSTGSVIKLYSYDLPTGISDISRGLTQSINEYLFEPALPLYIVERKERYPKSTGLERHLYGLKRRLEQSGDTYIESTFSVEHFDQILGKVKITSYVFKTRVKGKNVRESKAAIRTEFFKNNMSVLFSINGQVHGHYTSEFITRKLKFALLKGYLIIHVDCTELNVEIKNELFMASRDRLKKGEESRRMRDTLASVLRKSELKNIYKMRRQRIAAHGEDVGEVIRNVSKNLPISNDLLALLDRTFKLDQSKQVPKDKKRTPGKKKDPEQRFSGKRFPSFLRVRSRSKGEDGKPLVRAPLNGQRKVTFATDVENQYFDRVEEPGSFRIKLLNFRSSDGGEKETNGDGRSIGEYFEVTQSSPSSGIITTQLSPTGELQVGDKVKMEAVLTGPPGHYCKDVFWVEISQPEEVNGEKKQNENKKIGLPELVLVHETAKGKQVVWATLQNEGIEMNRGVVMHPLVEEGKLRCIYVNMDSAVLKKFKSGMNNASGASLDAAEKKYYTTVYFHTLFLFTITQKRQYTIAKGQDREAGSQDPVEIEDYLKDLFRNHYSSFLLNFGMDELMAVLEG